MQKERILMGKMDFNDFRNGVYEVVRDIPEGRVVTYGVIARLLGYPNHARLVGRALALTPPDNSIPVWRVVNSQGRTAPGWDEQKSLLELEGVEFLPSGKVNKRLIWNPFNGS